MTPRQVGERFPWTRPLGHTIGNSQDPGEIIRTVISDIEPEKLGFTLPHEHTLIDSFAFSTSYHSIVYDEDLLVEELGSYKQAGGSALVDMTSIGIGRNPEGVRRLSERTGLHIVMGTGWYRERTYPSYIRERSVTELAEILIQEINEGVDNSGIKAGVIGEIGTERYPISPDQERVFRAAARAQHATGAAIATHTTHFGTRAQEQLDLLAEEGVDLRRVIVGHLGDRRDLEMVAAIADRGAWIAVDRVGLSDQTDEFRATNVKMLIDRGYLTQILLSMDISNNQHMHYFGGHGYDHLIRKFVPLLRTAGVEDAAIRQITLENPKRAFAFTPNAPARI